MPHRPLRRVPSDRHRRSHRSAVQRSLPSVRQRPLSVDYMHILDKNKDAAPGRTPGVSGCETVQRSNGRRPAPSNGRPPCPLVRQRPLSVDNLLLLDEGHTPTPTPGVGG